MKKQLLLIVLTLIFSLVWFGCSNSSTNPSTNSNNYPEGIYPFHKIKDFSMLSSSGSIVSIASQNKVTMLILDLQYDNSGEDSLNNIIQDYAGKNVKFYEVYSSGSKSSYQNYCSNRQLQSECLFDSSSLIYSYLHMKYNPEYIVLNKEGIIIFRNQNYYTNYVFADIRQAIGIGLADSLGKIGCRQGCNLLDTLLPDTSGIMHKLSSYRGKVIALDFWASWCGGCMSSVPNIKALSEKFKNENFAVIGMSLDYTKDIWAETIKDNEMNWTQLWYQNGWDNANAYYKINVIPTMMVVDKKGRIVYFGDYSSDYVDPIIQYYLNE